MSPRGTRAWKADLLSGFVVVSLLAVLFTPLAIQGRVHGLRDEIEQAADPARTLVTRVQYLLARQTSTLRGYFITGDEQFLRDFRELERQEETAHAELSRYVDRLGTGVLPHFVEMRTLSREWHDRLDEDEIAPRRGIAPAGGAELPFDQTLYLDALASASRLDSAILAATRERRRAIQEAERQGFAINVILGLLAVCATLAVGHLSLRYRRLAGEAERRRLSAEESLGQKLDAIAARSRLLRGVTHDVKNPLGAADAYAELLELGLKGPLLPAQLEIVARMRRCIHGSLDIIHDLLDLASSESGIHLAPEPTEIARVAREVVDEHVAAAEREGLTLHLRVEPHLPALFTDRARVRQVLGNLLGNAIKYTPAPGTIELVVQRAERESPGSRGAWIALRVLDTGPGVPAEAHDRIFDEFTRLHPSSVEGHGLGLAISRRIARLLEGDITVDQAPGGGAEFTLWLPVGTALGKARDYRRSA